MNILVLNGPNLNMLGTREPEIYGCLTPAQIESKIRTHLDLSGTTCDFFQSNSEGALIDRIQTATADGIVLNAAAYTHYSYALRDAISGSKIPVIEVHMSNTLARDDFRHTSVIGGVCVGSISGFGHYSYILACDSIINYIYKKGE